MITQPTEDPVSFTDTLLAMTDDELFTTMRDLEAKSEETARAKLDTGDVLAAIALVEDEIEDRYPGQALAPYKQWLGRGS
jgi:hypothetical protein